MSDISKNSDQTWGFYLQWPVDYSPVALSLIKPASPFTQAAKFEGLMQGAHGAQATRVPSSGRGTRLLGLGLAGIAAKRAGVMRQVALKTRSGGRG